LKKECIEQITIVSGGNGALGMGHTSQSPTYCWQTQHVAVKENGK